MGDAKTYPFIVLVEVVLNVFLYWEIINYVEKLYQNKTSSDGNSKYREYVFIGEIRTALFEYQLENKSKSKLCNDVLSKLESSKLSQKVPLIGFCQSITLHTEYLGTE